MVDFGMAAELRERGHILTDRQRNVGGVALIGIEPRSILAHGIGSGVSTVR
jgi:hypothetical protein